MKVRELINGCGNIWKGLFTKNKDFKLTLFYWDNGLEEYRSIEKNVWEWLEDKDYLLTYRNNEIRDWYCTYNHILIEVDFLYNAYSYAKRKEVLLNGNGVY